MSVLTTETYNDNTPAAVLQRIALFRHAHYACQLCGASLDQRWHQQDGSPVDIVVGYKHALANGGTTKPDNLIVLCTMCHEGKGTNDL